MAAVPQGGPSTNFATSDVDSAGNVYIAYAEKERFHTYVVRMPHARLADCDQTIGNDPLTAVPPKNDP